MLAWVSINAWVGRFLDLLERRQPKVQGSWAGFAFVFGLFVVAGVILAAIYLVYASLTGQGVLIPNIRLLGPG